MALTKEQIRIMDGITGLNDANNVNNTVNTSNSTILSDDDIKRMDAITGLANYEQPKQTTTLRDEIINEDPDKAKQYEAMGPISIYEGAKREALENNGIFEFSGNYNNVIPDKREEQRKSIEYQEKIKKQERDKRVNNGTANIVERAIAYRDRLRAESEKEKEQTKYFLKDDPVQIQKRLERDKYRSDKIAQINESRLTSEIGFLENILPSFYYGTGVGDLVHGAKEKQIRLIKDKMIQGKPIYQSELDTFKRYYESEKEKQIRGYSFGGKLAEGLGKSLGFAFDFVGPTKFLRTPKLIGAVENIGLKTYLGAKELGASSTIAKSIAKTTEYSTNALLTSAVTTAINAPLRLFPEYQERMLGNEAKLTDTGNMIFQESEEKPATAFMKSLGGLYIAYLSEMLGGAIGEIGNGISKGIGVAAGGTVGRMLSKNPALNNFMLKSATELSKRYEALRGLPVIGKSTGWIKDTVHFDGFLEECGEEILEDVLRLTAGIDNQERNIENYKKAIFKTPEEWAVTAGVIMLQGAGLSATSYAIAKNMANSGASEKEISDVLVNTSESQKKEILNAQIMNGMVNIADDVRLTDEQKRRSLEIKNDIRQKLTNVGIDEKQAEDLSIMTGAMYERYGTRNDESREVFDKYINNLQIKYNVPVEKLRGNVQYNESEKFQGIDVAGAKDNEVEQAKKEWQKKGVESKYFKKWFGDSKVVDENGKPLVVYHGSPNEFEIFDSNKSLYGEVSKGFNFFTNKEAAYQNSAKDYANFAGTNGYKRNGKVYETYLSIKNPLHIQYTSNGMSVYNGEKRYSTPVEYYDNNYKQIQEEYNKGNYDGIIIENTDKNDDDSIIYLVPNSEQIKSADNQGTFDAENPNIYYQPFFNRLYNAVIDTLTNKSEKLSDLFEEANELHSLKEYFSNELKDVKFKKMPEWMNNNNKRMGYYSPLSNIIYLNFDKFRTYPNEQQQFFRTLLHEVNHAKQFKLVKYAIKNLNNEKLSKIDREALKNYLEINKISKKDVDNFVNFTKKHPLNNVKNSEKLEKKYLEFYSKYRSAAMEVDADNVALALLYKIDKTKNRVLGRYADYVFKLSQKSKSIPKIDERTEIRSFIERTRTNHFGIGRIDRIVNTQTWFQSIQDFDINSNIENNFGDSVENITEGIRADIQNILDENNISTEEFKINDIRIYGSYATGQNKNSSDLDFLVEYSGTMREDDAFNMFSDAELKLTDINGNKVKVDINPIREDKSGTIDEFLERNKDYNNSQNEIKTYYQDIDPEESSKSSSENQENERLIAGYNYQEVSDKLSELYSQLSETDERTEKELADTLMAKIHILEDAYEIDIHPGKYNQEQVTEAMLNAYYVMNNQEIPKEFVEADSTSARSYNDYKNIHKERKEERENKYRGYFRKEGEYKPIITIMKEQNASTALHEFAHMFLDLLNEMARVNPDAKIQLEAVNKWLNYTGEYTAAQHEKFANNFVAYLYKGKAPNSKLKSVFENFKEWLKSVYKSVLDIPNLELSDEVQELFDNIFGTDSYYQEQKLANDLLKQIKKKSKSERVKEIETIDNEILDETSKRYKEACYEIVSVGTGYDVKYLKTIFETDSKRNSFAKKREKIQQLLEKVEDKITITGGMRDNWKEFFIDTGVNYDTDKINGGYYLVEKALDVILNKDYNLTDFESELDERAKYYEKEIDKADREYKLLLKEYKIGSRLAKQNNTDINKKNIVFSAFCEWLENIDKEIRQDYEDRFIYDIGIIERNENLNKFDKAKRNIIKKALEVNNKYGINENEEYKEIVKEIMKNLDFLNPTDKARLTANILDVPSVDLLMGRIDEIMDLAQTMEDISFRRNLEQEIHKELQTTKNVKKNGRTVGKYNYKTNKIFEILRQLDRLRPEEANEERLNNKRFVNAEDNGFSYEQKLINKFLSYKAGGRTFADTELMKELYDEITRIKLIGKSAKSEMELMEKLNEEKDIEELIKIVEKKKKAGNLIKNYVSMLGNLESTVNAIFNKKIKEKYASEILYAETQAQSWQFKQKDEFEKEVANIYNLPQWMWDKKIIEYLAEKHTYTEIRRKYNKDGELIKTRNVERELTKMDIIQAYIWSKNEILEKRLINQFGEETLYNMFDEMSTEDVKLAELMMNTAQSFYNIVNKAFINKYGLDLPKVSCYFPSTPERGSEVDLYNDYSSKSLNNSFTKSRTQNEFVPMDFHNPIATLYSHIEGVAKFAFMSESLDRANLRFKDNDLKRVIISKFGEDVYRTLEQALMNVTYKKEATVFNGVNKIMDNMIGNWIQANVAIKPIVGLKQLLSANNYAVDMPYVEWQKGFLKALAHPKETIDYMMNIPYIKARFKGNFSNEFLKAQIENSAFATSKKLKDFCTLFVKIGDIGAIIFGGKPYIEYQIKQGLSEEEAIKQFILSTNRSQQSSAISSLSNFQVNMTRNPFGKLFIAFKNSPQQYVRMCGDAIISASNGDISKPQAAKLLFQYGYLQPFLYAVATSGSLFTLLFAGDDDDLIKDLSVSLFNLGSDSLPVFGDIYKYIINKRLYKEKNLPVTTPLVGDIEKEINRISKEDVTLGDYLESIGYIGLHVGLGYNSKAIGNMFSGVGDIVTGDFTKGSMKVLGYTKRRAEHIAGDD